MITIMNEQLITLAPKLKISTEEVTELVKMIAKQQIESDKVKRVVVAEEATAKVGVRILSNEIKLKYTESYNIKI